MSNEQQQENELPLIVECHMCAGDGWYIGPTPGIEPESEDLGIQIQCEYCYGEGEIPG